ncbi:MAG: protoporphyrinogen oxidase [Chloroflexaceae bacterium]|nr:protoporphyrinogen oxidase [Chloroflexaceae bacterium]
MLSQSSSYDCIVVGAGISGLAAAYAMLQRGANVLLIEARAEAGGSIRSERTTEGYVVENGPNTVVSKDPALLEHFAELGIADVRLRAERAGAKRYVVKDGKPVLLPNSPPTLLATPLLPLASKLRILAEPLLPRATTPDESVATFFARRLGSELMEQFIDPFVAGIYAGDRTACRYNPRSRRCGKPNSAAAALYSE